MASVTVFIQPGIPRENGYMHEFAAPDKDSDKEQ